MSRKKLLPALVLAGLLVFAPVMADDASDAESKVEAFISSIHPITGKVDVAQAGATLDIAPGYSYLQAKDAQRVLEQLWGNPPDSDVLGMIIPSTDPHALISDKNWAVVVTFVDDGYVSDADATKIDYSSMLKDMQEDAEDSNEERVKQGFDEVHIMGWAEQPSYDASSHKLYWARDLQFKSPDGKGDSRTLNYGIRVLGRKGYLSLNAIAPIDQLGQVKADMPAVLDMADFNEGQRYADYNAATDKAAEYGIAALVAGGIAAKAGLFTKIGALLLAFKKVILVGLAAVGGAIGKFFKGKKAQ
ncbi:MULTISPECIES: DUF2167 domain-containing protein [Dyella]|uniref:DUF2167 domain-containing protein n=2 Tax=Dyella TaxID=231454 RepID=A0A4R0YRU5_9GAMM|nr:MULTISPECIES: DUF2167 domain-containing protein [Dyella]TBR35849.1 DUF2167 domain-containing protein [Dyella terrae]TCI08603.1 DUF2167 domain-containing protein [Dyella soli]